MPVKIANALRISVIILLSFVWLALPPFADGALARKIALVIGNGDYREERDRLANPANDARDMASKLRSLKFDVIEAVDADLAGMQGALQRFGEALEGAEAGLFFYAGHGMEYAGKNYLFPTDATLIRETDVRLRLIDVEDVLWAMELAVPTRLVILDACRNNPLALELQRGLDDGNAGRVRQGLTEMDSATGTFIAFATAPGEVAFDGEGRNSPFTAAILSHLDSPGQDVDQLLREVRTEVTDATGGQQVPWNLSSLREPFFFGERGQSDQESLDRLVWESIARSDDPDMFRAYLDRFGRRGHYAREADERLTLASARKAAGGAALNALDLYRSAMSRRIVMGCNRSGNSPHFGLGAAPIPVGTNQVFGNGIEANQSNIVGGENAATHLAAQTPDYGLVIVKAAKAGCGNNDRISTDGRGGQWQSWHFLVANGGELINREQENWSGRLGNFRIESDIVRLDSRLLSASPGQVYCRSFVGYNQTRWRVFAGHACGTQTPTLEQLGRYFDLLEWS